MALSKFAQEQAKRFQDTDGTTLQHSGEEVGDYLRRLCEVNAERCREDVSHHLRANSWMDKRDVNYAANEAAQKVRRAEEKMAQNRDKYDKEATLRRKHEKSGEIELYEDPGRPHDADWLRAEVAPLCSDFQPGLMRAGIGVLAIRHGLDRVAELQQLGRPVPHPYALVMQVATMVHQGRFTIWVDPAKHPCPDRLIVPTGESPFDRRMTKQADGSWGLGDGKTDMHWPIKVPNADGWLPGQKPQTKETSLKLSDIGKYDPAAAAQAKNVPIEKDAAPARRIVQPPLRHVADAKSVPTEPVPSDPAKTPAYSGPPPSAAWCNQWLYAHLPEQRDVPLQPMVSQKAYGKALIDTLAIDRSTWTTNYRKDCFAFMLDKYHRMTKADADKEAEALREQQEQHAREAQGSQAPLPSPSTAADTSRMRQVGED